MQTGKIISLRVFFFSGIVLSLIGWTGLYFLLQYTLPTLGPRWLFFFLFMLALSGSSMPIIALLNRRFSGRHPASGMVIVRQSIWVGIYGNLLAWLQLGRVLNLALGFFLAVGFVIIEYSLRLRERSRWRPDGEDE